jgi:hypothetical protein
LFPQHPMRTTSMETYSLPQHIHMTRKGCDIAWISRIDAFFYYGGETLFLKA